MKVFITNVHIHGWSNRIVQFCQVSKGSVLLDIECSVRIFALGSPHVIEKLSVPSHTS